MTQHDRTTDATVAFTYGAYYYFVGTGGPTGAHGEPTEANVILAAKALYLQAAGCTAPRASGSLT